MVDTWKDPNAGGGVGSGWISDRGGFGWPSATGVNIFADTKDTGSGSANRYPSLDVNFRGIKDVPAVPSGVGEVFDGN